MKAKILLLLISFLFIILYYSSSTAQTCNETEVAEIDAIKQEVETMLIDATFLEVNLETGETLLAFYKDGDLIKISVTNEGAGDYYSAELYFRGGLVRHISADNNVSGNMTRDYYYFKNNSLICFTNEKSGNYKDAGLYKKAEEKWLEKTANYLFAIQ